MLELPARIYFKLIQKDLENKMVFIGGPRQVGKTTLSQQLISNFQSGDECYLNWDNPMHRDIINNQDWNKNLPLIIFDEIHKKTNWQTFVKGNYDVWKKQQNYIITGSARLDLYRKGGDSMLGRYHYHRIHPYSINELGNSEENMQLLFNFGGFPEPLKEQDTTFHRRWIRQRTSVLVREDLRDLEKINQIDKVEILANLLPSRVASLLSVKSISEDLSVSDKTIKNWILKLESLYYCFQVYPLCTKKVKSIKKTPKLYLWDWSQIKEDSARFENLVASQLLKYCHYQEDTYGYKMELNFLRDSTKKECDFIVSKEGKIEFAVECKLNNTSLNPNIEYFKKRMENVPKWYQVHMGSKIRQKDPAVEIIPFRLFCEKENMV